MGLLKGRELFEHQKLAIKFAYSNHKVLLAYGTGSGKESLSLAFGKVLEIKDKVDITFLCTSTKGIIPLEKEAKKFIDSYERVTLKDKAPLTRLKDYSGIILCTYSNLKEITKYVVKYQKSFAICFNEAHKIKNPKTGVSKEAKNLERLSLYTICMTATVITRDIEDFYNLISFVNPTRLGSYKKFLDKYTTYYTMKLQTKTGYICEVYKPTKWKALPQLLEDVSDILLSYFPKYNIKYIPEYVTLTNREEYLDISRDALAYNEEDEKQLATRLIYLQHYLNRQKPKVLKLIELTKQHLTEGVIIYANNYEELEILQRVFDKIGINYKAYTGKLNEKKAKEVEEWFVSNPNNKALFITEAGGQSINLQVIQHLIFYSLPFSIGKFLQVVGRISRQDSKFDIFYISIIITLNTLETYKYTYLQMFGEVYSVLFQNNALPKSYNIPSMNKFVLKKMMKDSVLN